MRHHHLRLSAVCFGILSASGAYASCGSGACAVNTNWDEHSTSQPGLSLDLRQSFARADQLRSGSNKIAADTTFAGEVENLRTITRITTLTADYTLDQNFGITAQLPYVSRDHNHNLGPYVGNVSAGVESFNAKALGDIKLVGRYRTTMNEENHSSIGIKFGLKLASGTQRLYPEHGRRPQRSHAAAGQRQHRPDPGRVLESGHTGQGVELVRTRLRCKARSSTMWHTVPATRSTWMAACATTSAAA